MNELADRIEALTGPDREIDAAIADAIGWWPRGYTRIDYNGRDRRWNVDKRNGLSNNVDCHTYTASIDAAMTLVPEGHSWMLLVGNRSSARVTDCTVDECTDLPDFDAPGATPALALCAAALRAKAAQ